ncbi:hypothetical protein [Halomarina ordinaria]|uniref:Small CPxCG-related zinc finger protein n=1 Tax=Halomarina ordinaria TaxID=3033939 RepID=A0ABD5U652_9EURY|nr:hypothetical protein [Halomarina sp. PSRA2]
MTRDDDLRLPRDSVDPAVETKARLTCLACEATFPRREVVSEEKGRLRCPECDSADLERVSTG